MVTLSASTAGRSEVAADPVVAGMLRQGEEVARRPHANPNGSQIGARSAIGKPAASDIGSHRMHSMVS